MNAAEQVAEAIATYGRPLWAAHIPYQIRQQVPTSEIGRMLATAHRSPDSVTRADLYADITDWCANNVFGEVTITRLIEVSGLSAPTVRKFIGDRVDLFRKLRRGVWEVRDPKADRAATK
jgi:hypothetical protein